MTDPTPNPAAIRRRLAALSDLMNAGVALCNASRALVITSAADPDLQATIALATARSAIERALGQLDTGWTPPDLPPAAREFLDRGRPERDPWEPATPAPLTFATADSGGNVRRLVVDPAGDVCPRCGGMGTIPAPAGRPTARCPRCEGRGRVALASPFDRACVYCLGSGSNEGVRCPHCAGTGRRLTGSDPTDPGAVTVTDVGSGDALTGAEVRRAFSDEPEEGAA